ncbi:MAG TPA: hypothetical protein VGG74_21310 [Kofleriaceae bacterium]|jgi:hypothetical protein
MATTDAAGRPLPLSTDPVDFAQDPTTGDLVIVGGKLQTVAGAGAAEQGIRRRIKRVAGEWFLDLDAGVRWLENDAVTAQQAILAQGFDPAKADAEIRAAILDAPAVTSVASLAIAFDRSTRKAAITFGAVCSFADLSADALVTGAMTVP